MQNETKKTKIAMVGLAVMGKNLALNMASRGISVTVYNRSAIKTEELMAEVQHQPHLLPFIHPVYSIAQLVQAVERPRKLMLMVKAGEATDDTIAMIAPHLEAGDILIDGGNAYFEHTMRRSAQLALQGIHFLGVGVSGGEEGALRGPAIMPGGDAQAYEAVAPIFTAIAAQVQEQPCCAYMGVGGAGHYVKMVHNGIEYGDMQLISEAYHVLKDVFGCTPDALHDIFSTWNAGELDSYLIEITAQIFATKDVHTDEPIVDMILDRASQKGTGKWTSVDALDQGVPLTIITSAVFARYLSAQVAERHHASTVLRGPQPSTISSAQRDTWIERVRQALFASKICSYAQGFAQLRVASTQYGWQLPFVEIAKLFRGGCIIRARFLQNIADAYIRQPDLPNLILDAYFQHAIDQYQHSWRAVVSLAVEQGIPVPAMSAALAYYDAYRTKRLPANLIQAQRDYFGAHTFERIDRPGTFHHPWSGA
jgi:6-phosphogluconate dehydrogenase